MNWETILKEDTRNRFLDKTSLEEYNKKVDEVYDIINHYHLKGILDYDKHIMAFTSVIDEIEEAIKNGD